MSGLRAKVEALPSVHFQDAVRNMDDGPHPDDCVYRYEVADLIPEGAVLVTEGFRQAAIAVVDAYLANDEKGLLGACADLSAEQPE